MQAFFLEVLKTKFFKIQLFEGVLRAAASKLQDFLSFKKSVPKKSLYFKEFCLFTLFKKIC